MKFMKSIIPLFSLFLLLSIGISCKKSSESGKPEAGSTSEIVVEDAAPALEPGSFKDEMKGSNTVIIDMRFPVEYEQGHIDGAININFFDGKFKDNILALD